MYRRADPLALVTKLDEHGHEAVAASPDSGVNTLNGDGLAEALDGADAALDLPRSFRAVGTRTRGLPRHSPVCEQAHANAKVTT